MDIDVPTCGHMGLLLNFLNVSKVKSHLHEKTLVNGASNSMDRIQRVIFCFERVLAAGTN